MKHNRVCIFSLAMITFFMLCMFAVSTVHASDDDDDDMCVVQTKTTDDAVYVYVRGTDHADEGQLSVQIGTEACDDIQVIGKEQIKIRTLIILDNSLSTSEVWGNQALDLIQKIVDAHADGEEFKLITYAQSVSELTSYTSDYVTLKTAIQGIKYVKQESYLKDTLYDLLDGIYKEKENIFYRVVIIADGVDHKDITYTQAELTDLMKKAGIPIHTIGIVTSDNSSKLETLLSYSRQTNGTYRTVKKGDATEPIVDEIEKDKKVVCLKVAPSRAMQDGSNKETKILINGKELHASVWMPFASGREEVVEPVEPTIEPTATPTPTVAPTAAPTPEPTPAEIEEEPVEEKSVPLALIAVIAVVAIAAVAGLLILITQLTKTQKKEPEQAANNNAQPSSEGYEDDGKTEGFNFYGSGNSGAQDSYDDGKTVSITPKIFITLIDIDNERRVFSSRIVESIIIGKKEPADIIIGDDTAVSRRHCKIMNRGGDKFFVEDLNSSNGTYYNDELLNGITHVENGGVLTIGKCRYKIKVEHKMG